MMIIGELVIQINKVNDLRPRRVNSKRFMLKCVELFNQYIEYWTD